MKKLDCLGDICPIPLMKLQALESDLQRGVPAMVVTDHSCTCQSILSYCKAKGYAMRVEEPMSGIWEISILPAGKTEPH